MTHLGLKAKQTELTKTDQKVLHKSTVSLQHRCKCTKWHLYSASFKLSVMDQCTNELTFSTRLEEQKLWLSTHRWTPVVRQWLYYGFRGNLLAVASVYVLDSYDALLRHRWDDSTVTEKEEDDTLILIETRIVCDLGNFVDHVLP